VIGTDQDQVTTYLYAVRAALGDLPDATRDELLEDLPEHLAEVLADSGGSLTDRLGPPGEYAAELRASIGFVGGFPDPPPNRFADYRATVLSRLHTADLRLGPLLGYPKASEFLVLLRPAWWVLRGYLLAMALAWLLSGSGQSVGLLPRVGGSDLSALVLLAAGVLGSIWFGRRRFTLAAGPQVALYAGSVILVLAGIGGFLSADSTTLNGNYPDTQYTDVSNPADNVQDIFVYDERGQLVPGARLFDQEGTALNLGNPYCYDADTGESAHSTHMGYPYCPQNAPFTAPSAERAASASPSAGPSAPAVPTPAASPSTGR
jgi:hypothetical protein